MKNITFYDLWGTPPFPSYFAFPPLSQFLWIFLFVLFCFGGCGVICMPLSKSSFMGWPVSQNSGKRQISRLEDFCLFVTFIRTMFHLNWIVGSELLFLHVVATFTPKFPQFFGERLCFLLVIPSFTCNFFCRCWVWSLKDNTFWINFVACYILFSRCLIIFLSHCTVRIIALILDAKYFLYYIYNCVRLLCLQISQGLKCLQKCVPFVFIHVIFFSFEILFR